MVTIKHKTSAWKRGGLELLEPSAILLFRYKFKHIGSKNNWIRSNSPWQSFYDELEVDEFWTYVGSKKNKVWLIYAYHRATGEIVAWVWGKRNLATARDLRQKITELGITFDTIYTDDWTSFVKTFKSDNHVTGKANTVGIEGNNCRLRHRIRRAFRKTCCFSKKLYNHFKSFELVFFYINFGHV